MRTASTTAYLSAVESLKSLTSDKLLGSGLEVTIGKIGAECPFAAIQLDGECVDELKTVINDSIRRILTFRKAMVQSELSSICSYLEQTEQS